MLKTPVERARRADGSHAAPGPGGSASAPNCDDAPDTRTWVRHARRRRSKMLGMVVRGKSRWAWLAAALVAVLLGSWLWPRHAHTPLERSTSALTPPVAAPSAGVAAAPPGASGAAASGAGSSAAASGAASTSAARSAAPRPAGAGLSPETQRRRQQVLDALAQRTPAPNPSGGPGAEGTLVDRTGVLGDAVRVLNRDLLPLVSQCFDQAHERQPALKGMLALGVKLASAEGVGGIIETVEPAEPNELHDDELIECIRQSAFSIELPTPESDARGEFQLTIPFGIHVDAGAPAP